jgi:hypothetical protein
MLFLSLIIGIVIIIFFKFLAFRAAREGKQNTILDGVERNLDITNWT